MPKGPEPWPLTESDEKLLDDLWDAWHIEKQELIAKGEYHPAPEYEFPADDDVKSATLADVRRLKVERGE